MVVALLCVAQFVVVLDATIVAIALPAMQADLGMSTTTLGWVITAYTLTFGGCLLAAGRLADRVGRRRVFVAGLGLFTLASLACGAAPSGGALLGRARRPGARGRARGPGGAGAADHGPPRRAATALARSAGGPRPPRAAAPAAGSWAGC